MSGASPYHPGLGYKSDMAPGTKRPPAQAAAGERPAVDVTLIDAMLQMSPVERLRQNDRMAAVAMKLKEAFARKTAEWPSRKS